MNFSLGAHDVNIPNLNKLLKNWPQVKDLGLNLYAGDDPITEVFNEHLQESLNSKIIRFNMHRSLLSFLWPNLSSSSLHLSRMILSVEAKSSFLNTRNISDITGNEYQVTHKRVRPRQQKMLL